MYKFIRNIVLLLVCGLGIVTSVLYNENTGLRKEVSIMSGNQKAFLEENDTLKNKCRLFKFQIEQLNYSNDVLLNKMDSVRKELKIKDSEIKQLQFLKSEAVRTDTIIFTDTIFKESSLCIDTIIGDNWYKLQLGLQYPSTINVSPKFISEKYITVSSNKETINPPKKCWVARLFQKKHTVLEINVVEGSPYIENKQQKFVEIIK